MGSFRFSASSASAWIRSNQAIDERRIGLQISSLHRLATRTIESHLPSPHSRCPLVRSGEYSHPVRQTLLLALAPDGDHLWPIEVMVADRKKVELPVIGRHSAARISGAMRSDAGNTTGRTTQRHGAGDAGSAGKPAGVYAMLIESESRVRVLPDRIHSLGLIRREISRIIRSGEDESVSLGEILVELKRTPSASARIEEIDDRPTSRRSVGRRQIERIALCRIRRGCNVPDLRRAQGSSDFETWPGAEVIARAEHAETQRPRRIASRTIAAGQAFRNFRSTVLSTWQIKNASSRAGV